ncbi:S8 family peptidase [Pontibacter actiniarum]|uniref:Peptidase S8 and S53 subtilisin kexin sedolisin n=1 Tax=Pontibacter actiniarum TaxID=323450 RepID=A0A1X9YRU3_9BACT|nr:S8 family serine peptidase [Pontibacter actiniarum]ARS35589.1 peptidase S8 and S53 subtilisin kexin sedolisin [Pontibacter actiniarum]
MYSKLTSRVVYPALALALLFGCSPDNDQASPVADFSADAASAAQSGGANPAVKLKRGHYLVVATSNSLPADIKEQLRGIEGEVTGLMTEVGIATVTSSDPNFAAKASKINGVGSVIRDMDIQWLSPDQEKVVEFDAASYGNPPASGDDDRYFNLQWGHDAVDAPEAWNAGYRGKGVRVAVLDSGFDLDHADLAPNIDFAASKNFVPGEELGYALADVGSHGSHTAGTIAAADNGIGTIGVAPEAQLILVKVLRDSGSGSFSWILEGILHAVNQGADVISMSIGASMPANGKFLDDNGTPDDPTDDFIVSDTKAVHELLNAINKVTTYATKKGATVIASAGNEANNGNKDKSLIHLPSGAPNVISISASAPQGWALAPTTANLDFMASYSNYGTSDVDFAAPGGDYVYPGIERATIGGVNQYVYVFDYVFSTGSSLTPGKNSYYWSVGTSMAAPHAAGVAAIIIGKHGGQMDPALVKAALRSSADDLGKPGRDPYYGYGRVNAFKAVSAL